MTIKRPRFFLSKSVSADFNKMAEDFGWVKKVWYKNLLLSEAHFLLWAYSGRDIMGDIKPNSGVALKYLDDRQRGKVVRQFGLNAQLEEPDDIQFPLTIEEVKEYQSICEFFNVSPSALLEFALSEVVLRANSETPSFKINQLDKPLFTLRQKEGLTEGTVQMLNKSQETVIKVRQSLTESKDVEEKVVRLKVALFIENDFIPSSYKREFNRLLKNRKANKR